MAQFKIGDFVAITSGVYSGWHGYVTGLKYRYLEIRLTNGQEVDVLYSYVEKVKE